MARRALVVYYSRTGTTRRVAGEIAERLEADLEPIVPVGDRSGLTGCLAAAWDAVLRRPADVEPPEHDPADYDLCVVGTPVWAWSVSGPVRAYLSRVRERLPRVALFCTARLLGTGRALAAMEELAQSQPVAGLGLRLWDFLKGEPGPRTAEFCDALRAASQDGGQPRE